MIQRTRNQSIMLSLPSNQSANHAILTFQPTPSIPLLQQYIISVPYLDAYSSTISRARIREILLFFFSSCVVSEWHHSYTRESDDAHSAAKGKGGRFLPPKNASSTIRAQQAA